MSEVKQTPYGFEWGNVSVERTASLELRKGKPPYHCLTLRTPKRCVQVTFTPSGLVSEIKDFAI